MDDRFTDERPDREEGLTNEPPPRRIDPRFLRRKPNRIRLTLECVVYALAAGWWMLLTVIGVSRDGVHLPDVLKVALSVAYLVLFFAVLSCLLARCLEGPGGDPDIRKLSIAAACISLVLLLSCGGLFVFIMWIWN